MNIVIKPVALAFETSYGVSGTPTSYAKVRACNFSVQNNYKTIPDIANRVGSSQVIQGARTILGNIAGYLNPDGGGNWLKLFFGSHSVSDLGGGLYKHTFTNKDGILSATLVKDEGNEIKKVTGLVANTLRLSATSGIVEFALEVLAQELAPGTAYSPTATTVDPFKFSDVNIYFGTSIANALTTSPVPVDVWDIVLGNNIKVFPPQVGSRTISNVRFGKVVSHTQLKFVSENSVYENYVDDETTKSMVIRLTSGTAILDIEFPTVMFVLNSKPYESGSIMTEVLGIIPIYDDTAKYKVRAVLTNGVANYN